MNARGLRRGIVNAIPLMFISWVLILALLNIILQAWRQST